MPFPQQTPLPFTSEGVTQLAAGQTGCYGIYREGQWIYIGRAECLRTRLQQHVADPRSLIWQHGPTHFVAVVSPDYINLEKALIRECFPCCNQKVG